MRPITLDIEGLRSFRAPQRIDFAGRRHVAIIGDTGAGKSSILEALTFALYGRLTFTPQGNQELVNATSTALRVVLRFAVAGERWEVARTLKRAAKGTVGGAMAVLHRLGDDDEVVEAYEGVRQVNAAVESLLGLDADAFLRAVVLPQGQFARLLVDDDQRERAAVLRQIWRTDELVAAGAAAEQAVAELAPLRGRVAQALAAEPPDPDAHLLALQATAEVRATEAVSAAERLAAVQAHAADLEAATGRLRVVTELAAGVTGWDAASAADEAARVVGAARQVAADAADDRAALEVAREQLAAVPDDDDGLDFEAVVQVDAALAALPDQLADVAAAAEGVEVAAAAVADAESASSGAAEAAAAARAAADEAAEARAPLAEAALAASAARQAFAERVASARSAAAAAERRRAGRDQAAADLAAGVTAAGRLAEAARLATAALDDAARADAAASAAHGLHAGDACPVCERSLPTGWSAPAALDLAGARAAADGARAAAAEAEAARCVADDRLRSAAEHLAEAEAALDPDLDLTASDEALRAPYDQAVAEAERALVDHDEGAAALVAAAAVAEAEHAGARAEHAAAVRVHDERVGRHRELASRVDAAVAALAEGWRPAAAAEVAPLRSALAARREVLDARCAERQRCAAEVDRRRDRLDGHERARQALDADVRGLWAALGTQRARLVDAAQRAALAVPDLPGAGDVDDLEEAVAATADAVVVVATGLHAAAAEAGAVLREAAAAIGDTDVAGVARAADDARYAARRAAEEADRFAGRIKAIDKVREAGEHLETTYLALADLAAALKPGAFPKWLTLRRSRDLLVHASRVLADMTGGRYAFADLADDSSDWLVVDGDNGMARSPASLSGGEKFVASLALALGMVEMMARSGGRLESLFLDEGFGALDRDNLDAAVEALATAAASGRMVATISHVRAVAEQVEHVLAVTREPGGSTVRWLDDTERRALALDDVTGDAAVHRLLS